MCHSKVVIQKSKQQIHYSPTPPLNLFIFKFPSGGANAKTCLVTCAGRGTQCRNSIRAISCHPFTSGVRKSDNLLSSWPRLGRPDGMSSCHVIGSEY
ncbi:hypothetical protein Bpfe_013727 [Biomphalaria pfeifferi]|uniref:Uncharacterized protein n=1 Tax=Biomphalaria pfeifferi TaxID=112525 RepID=A0AAD8BLE8_BIOPF|nr:hypothetical protein Bpfe_013727 [Biomphalaria pfeifferi]